MGLTILFGMGRSVSPSLESRGHLKDKDLKPANYNQNSCDILKLLPTFFFFEKVYITIELLVLLG